MTTTNLLFVGDELKEIAKVTLKKRKFRVPYQDFMLEHGHITQEEYDEGQRTPCFTLVKDHGIYVMSGAANDKELWNKEEKKFTVAYAKGFDPDQEDLWDKTYAVSGDDFAEAIPLTKTQLLNIAKGQPLRIRMSPTEIQINA
jgi:hypothetical protein|tara:strand:- start:135 stop:563 length:429 start_codon:yes stop_codon:yes gene_type:complete